MEYLKFIPIHSPFKNIVKMARELLNTGHLNFYVWTQTFELQAKKELFISRLLVTGHLNM